MKAIITGLLLFLPAPGVFAQQQAAPPPLSERVDVSIVNVDVTVLDHDGQPVRDLSAADFEVFEDGKPQRITNFSAIVNAAPKAASAATSAPVQDAERYRRKVLVMVDEMSLAKPRRIQAVKALQRFVDERFTDGDEWSVVAIGWESRTLLPFTADRTAIAGALMRARGAIQVTDRLSRRLEENRTPVRAGGEVSIGPDALGAPGIPGSGGTNFDSSSGGGGSVRVDSATSLNLQAAVIHAARAMASLPGKKAILLVTGYVPGYEKPSFGNDDNIILAQMHAAMVREANASNVNIFVLDPLGVGGNFDQALRLTAGSYWLASETGGSYLRSNAMQQALQRFDEATANYYEIGYPTSADDSKYHHISVQVKREGSYTVKHREGYVRLPADVAFERGLTSPLALSSWKSTLPVSLDIGKFEPSESGKAIIPLRTTIPMKSVMFLYRSDGRVGRLHVYVTVFDRFNKPLSFQHFIETLTIADASKDAELVVARTVPLKKGTYNIYVTVRDELSEEVGIASRQVTF